MFNVFCRVCELLQSGAVMNKSYQPNEGHIPFLLQFFIDYNLYGMNLVNLGAVKFRRSPNKGRGQDRSDSAFWASSKMKDFPFMSDFLFLFVIIII